MRIDIVSIFPDYLHPLHLSLVGKAVSGGVVDLHVHDLRNWTHDRHRTVDDTPYGGGPGMVMRPEPWGEALDEIRASGGAERPWLVVPTPSGARFDQTTASDWSQVQWLVFACGRYEGIDSTGTHGGDASGPCRWRRVRWLTSRHRRRVPPRSRSEHPD